MSDAIMQRPNFPLTAFTDGQVARYGEITTSIRQLEIANMALDLELACWRKLVERKDELAALRIERELEIAAIKHRNQVLVLELEQARLTKQLRGLQADIKRLKHADALAAAKHSVDEANKATVEERRLRQNVEAALQKSERRVAEFTRIRGSA